MCALVYQVAWLRELRLVFGASTAASAAVLAVFMGGLGVGGWLLGKRVDKYRNPLELYANLELGVAVTAAITPLLVIAARKLYITIGGSAVLGLSGATIVRLLLTTLILGASTFLMGGTLPAAARAVSKATDAKRRDIGTLYAVNTLGAVTGAFAANFLLLEVFGTRMTLWLACLVNALVGMTARSISRLPAPPGEESAPEDEGESAPATVLPAKLFWFPSAAAAVSGFAFLLMELVWYRMLGPILGGSSYTFGLILCVALLGIGVGGGIYSAFGKNRPASLNAFAWTCALEALCIMIPFAVGDGVALTALILRGFGALGFVGHVGAWTVVASFVVLPAAIVSGYQFPLIIALFGSGDARVGRHVGIAYATNTVGSITGSLAGGFGLIPMLSAPGCWKLVGALLAATGVATAMLAAVIEKRRQSSLLPIAIGSLAACMILSTGPTAYWRHGGIGAGRAAQLGAASRNELTSSLLDRRRGMVWEADGVESSVALFAQNGYSFSLNGKSDGNARSDAATQVMGGLIGAALRPDIRNAFVIGLGTGSTAGWLAKVPGIERVDVAELEPMILRVARDCAAVNENVIDNPLVHVALGDARELLLTARLRYELIFSEPSNPYRAGVASLYSQEFYEAAALALDDRGLFLQWLQSYDVDGEVVDTALSTISSVFPHVSLWQTKPGDLIIVASRQPVLIDANALRKRLAAEPFSRAMPATWNVPDAEGFLAHHVANTEFSRHIAEVEKDAVNVDDRNVLEYAFARSVGKSRLADTTELWRTSRRLGFDRPTGTRGAIDWALVDLRRAQDMGADEAGSIKSMLSGRANRFLEDARRYRSGDLEGLRASYRQHPRDLDPYADLWMFAEAFAIAGEDDALPLIERLRSVRPVDATVLDAQFLMARSRLPEAGQKLSSLFRHHRDDPWVPEDVLDRALSLAEELASRDKLSAPGLAEDLSRPFAVGSREDQRLLARLHIGLEAGSGIPCVSLFEPYEPVPMWSLWFLQRRSACYRGSSNPLADRAEADLRTFLSDSPTMVGAGIQDLHASEPAAVPLPPSGSSL